MRLPSGNTALPLTACSIRGRQVFIQLSKGYRNPSVKGENSTEERKTARKWEGAEKIKIPFSSPHPGLSPLQRKNRVHGKSTPEKSNFSRAQRTRGSARRSHTPRPEVGAASPARCRCHPRRGRTAPPARAFPAPRPGPQRRPRPERGAGPPPRARRGFPSPPGRADTPPAARQARTHRRWGVLSRGPDLPGGHTGVRSPTAGAS